MVPRAEPVGIYLAEVAVPREVFAAILQRQPDYAWLLAKRVPGQVGWGVIKAEVLALMRFRSLDAAGCKFGFGLDNQVQGIYHLPKCDEG